MAQCSEKSAYIEGLLRKGVVTVLNIEQAHIKQTICKSTVYILLISKSEVKGIVFCCFFVVCLTSGRYPNIMSLLQVAPATKLFLP